MTSLNAPVQYSRRHDVIMKIEDHGEIIRVCRVLGHCRDAPISSRVELN